MSIFHKKKEAHDVAFAAEMGKQKAQIVGTIAKYALLALLVVGLAFGGWMFFKKGINSAKEVVLPCFMQEKGCEAKIYHPSEWSLPWGGDDDEEVSAQSTPASQTATAPQSTPVEEPVDTRPCANDWIPGSCYWEKRVSAE